MNCNRFIRGVAMCCVSLFLLVSCQKEAMAPSLEPIENFSNPRLSGSIADNPATVAKVPMITSADFMADQITDYFSHQPLLENAKGSGAGGRDRTSPTVSITSPSTGAIVSNTVSVQVSATDNVGVTSVLLKVDGVTIASDNSAPYSFGWNTTGLSSGTHSLSVTATDAAGNAKSSAIQVGYNTQVGSDITPPTIVITSPSNGSSVSSTVTVTASASDNIAVNAVNFKVNDVIVGTDNTSPYTFAWNTSGTTSGIHNLTATATDAAGNTNSSSIAVTVNTTVIPPTIIPASFQLTTPTPGSQGNEGSCVAFAIAYGARSIEQFYITSASSYNFSSNVFSPEYVYNQTKFQDCGTGTSPTTVLDLIKVQGVCSWQYMPYNDINGCSIQPDAGQVQNASAFKIASYVLIPNFDRVAIKTMIASKHAVIITIIADNSFTNAGPGFVWKTNSGSGALRHTLIICGYDDVKNAYKVMNSWGTSWGDAGFSWIDYDYFPQISTYDTYAIQ